MKRIRCTNLIYHICIKLLFYFVSLFVPLTTAAHFRTEKNKKKCLNRITLKNCEIFMDRFFFCQILIIEKWKKNGLIRSLKYLEMTVKSVMNTSKGINQTYEKDIIDDITVIDNNHDERK